MSQGEEYPPAVRSNGTRKWQRYRSDRFDTYADFYFGDMDIGTGAVGSPRGFRSQQIPNHSDEVNAFNPIGILLARYLWPRGFSHLGAYYSGQ